MKTQLQFGCAPGTALASTRPLLMPPALPVLAAELTLLTETEKL